MSAQPKFAHLRNDAVYPGHPAVVALCIMDTFPNLAAAEAKSDRTDYASALSSDRVPGAGGNVWAALHLLTFAQTHSPEDTWARAEEVWQSQVGPNSGNHENAFEPGRAQAVTFKAAFLDHLATWGKAPVVQARPHRRP